MAIGNFGSRVSEDSIQKTKDKLNPPEYDAGFGPEDSLGGSSLGGDDELDSIFGGPSSSNGNSGGDFDDPFDSGGDIFGGGGSDPFSNMGMGGDPFGGGAFGSDPFSNNSMGGLNQDNKASYKDELASELEKYCAEGTKAVLVVLQQLILSIKNRNIDDYSLLSSRMVTTGLVVSGLGILSSICGAVGNVEILKLANIGIKTLLCGGITLGSGLMVLGLTAVIKVNSGDYEYSGGSIKDIDNAPSNESFSSDLNNSAFNFDNNDNEEDAEISQAIDDIFAGLDGLPDTNSGFDDFDSDSSDSEDEDDIFSQLDSKYSKNNDTSKSIDSLIDNIPENANNGYLTRKFLYETFSPFFPVANKEFSSKREIVKSSDEFLTILSLVNEAIASALGLDDFDCEIIKAEETNYSYIIWIKRTAKMKKIPDIERELADYFKSDENDVDVTASIKTLGGNYIATIVKGNKDTVTIGDALTIPEVEEYFLNESNKLPFIMGIDMYGKPLVADAKDFPTMMIVGIMRCGKSWYLASLLGSLVAFNPPSDIQLLIIDPKKTPLFTAFSFLPHCCGLHDGKNIINILEDIINIEAERRKEINSSQSCDSIWALRKKGIELPILYIVIDEVVSIVKELEKSGMEKTFLGQLLTIITQLPSVGIYLLFVPHRAQGIIDKTTRTMVPYVAAVKAKTGLVNEALDVQGWKRPLTKPGDIALNTSDFADGPKYVRGTGLGLKDEENFDILVNMAKAYYKIGVNVPDMSGIGIAYNRDEESIKDKLQLISDKKLQFDFNKKSDYQDYSDEYQELDQ